MTARNLLQEALKLSPDARLRLAKELRASVASERPDPELTKWQKQELGRRAEDARKNPPAFVGWDEIRKRLNRRAYLARKQK